MASRASGGVLAALVLLTLAAGLLLGIDARGQVQRQARARHFQVLVGGLGFGPATDLNTCPCACDPRLDVDCAHRYGPIPGGQALCPHHACSIFPVPPLPQRTPVVETGR